MFSILRVLLLFLAWINVNLFCQMTRAKETGRKLFSRLLFSHASCGETFAAHVGKGCTFSALARNGSHHFEGFLFVLYILAMDALATPRRSGGCGDADL